MICPHDRHECDNRGCRYGGCQGRTAADTASRLEENRSQTEETLGHRLPDAQCMTFRMWQGFAGADRAKMPAAPLTAARR
jgi:hypothetical protein